MTMRYRPLASSWCVLWCLMGSVQAADLPLQASSAEEMHSDTVKSYRAKTDRHFRDPLLSPLRESDRASFTGLEYFLIEPSLNLSVGFETATDDSVFQMPTYNNKTLSFSHFGTLSAWHEGRQFQLKVYQRHLGAGETGILLVPFRDTTNASETYAGGRYMELELPLNDASKLDFNRAMNPWCAYDSEYACPIPPRENHLDFAVRAGEKRFK